jgi:excisionase family DNA binding protein
MTGEMKPLVGVRELAEVLGLSMHTIYRLAMDGRIPFYKPTKVWRFDLEDVKAALHKPARPQPHQLT